MSKVELLDTEYVTLWYYPDKKIVHHVFHKYIYGQQLRDAMLKGLEVFQENGATKWLSDDRKNSALPQADMTWGVESWLPEMIASGWKYWGVVLPDKAVGKATMERLVESFEAQGIVIQLFEDPDEAMTWLESI